MAEETHLHTCSKCHDSYECSFDLGRCPPDYLCTRCAEPGMEEDGNKCCGATKDGWVCTLTKEHSWPEHIAHFSPDQRGGVGLRWPVAAEPTAEEEEEEEEETPQCPNCERTLDSADDVLTCDWTNCGEVIGCEACLDYCCEGCEKNLCGSHSYTCQCCDVVVCEDCRSDHGT